MADQITGHSRLVYWLKVTMPILALAILSTLFLFARHIDYEGNLPFAEIDLDQMANDPRLTKPEYTTMTTDGAAVRIVADNARPGATAQDPVDIDEVLAVYDTDRGATITVRSDRGSFDTTGGILDLAGRVVLVTSDGYTFRSERLVSSLGTTDVTADGPVVTDAPLGRIESGAMRLTGTEGSKRLVFNEGVRLLYQP